MIVFEGLDGAGKSVNARLLENKLKLAGLETVYTHEPTPGPVGNLIRERLGRTENQPHLEALLFAADRLEHVAQVIQPALNQGKVVLCDRYMYSSFAYQAASGVDLEWVKQINKFAPIPDLAVYLDLRVREAVKRSDQKGIGLNKFESDMAFRQRARRIFLSLSRKGMLTRIDSERPLPIVNDDVEQAAMKVLRGLKLPVGKQAVPYHDVR